MLSLTIQRSICAGLMLMGIAFSAPSSRAEAPQAAEFDVFRLTHVAPVDAKRLLTELTTDSAGELQIITDRDSDVLLIRGPKELRVQAASLLEQIDRPPIVTPPVAAEEIRTYPVEAASRDNVIARLQEQFGRSLRVAADPSGTRIIVVGTPDVQEQAAKLLAVPSDAIPPLPQPPRMQGRESVGRSGSSQTPVATFQFRSRSSADVVQTLQQLFASKMQQQTADAFLLHSDGHEALSVRFDRSRNRCFVAGPDSVLQQLMSLLTEIDRPQSNAEQKTRLMLTHRAEPEVVRKAVDAWRGGVVSEQSSGDQSAPKPVSSFAANVRSAAYQSLGVGPSAAKLQMVAQQVPAAEPNETPPPDAPVIDPLRRPSSEVEVQALPDLDVIILRGLGADVEELTRIINEIERLSAETTPEIEVYQLQHVQGTAANQVIAQVLESLAGTLQGRVTITALGKPNALLLIGWGEAVEAAKKLIAELDQPVAPTTQVRVFRLKYAPAVQVQATIEQFYAGRNALSPQVEITADPRTNSLVVNAAPRDLEEIALLIEELDVGTSEAVNQGRVIQLQNSLAADVAQTLQAAIDAARGGPGVGPNAGRSAVLEMLMVDPEGRRVVTSGLLNDVRITPDPRTNTLIVTGPEESMDLVEALIRELDESPAASAQIKVFQVINGDATEMVLMLRSLFPAQPGATSVPQLPTAEGETSLVPVRFAVDTRTNSIIATGAASDLLIIEALLARLDAEEAQQRINRVYRLRNSPAIDVAVAINDFLRSEQLVQRAAPGRPNPFQQIESEVVVVAEPVGNALIISASPRFFDEILELVKSLDEQPPQVLVQVIIAEVDLDHFHELGVELGLQDSLLFDRSLLGDLITTTATTSESTPAGVVTTTNQLIQAASLTPGFNFNNLPLGNSGSDRSLSTADDVAGQALSHFNVGRVNSELDYGGLVLSASSENVSVLIRALDHSRHVEILSRPQIMTLDNQPAFIQVGQRVPRIVATSINTIGQINTIELEDVGLILGLTPRISPEGMVVMDIDAEKSQVGPESEGIPISVSVEGEVIRSPRVDITRAQTTISAASGQTVVLGGLITKEHMSTSRKVPWLGDIPILGALFRYDSNMNDRKELLIIMTPHVIRGQQDADYHKQVEMARMSWCTADVFDLLGPGSPPPILSGQYDDAGVPIIYPDQTPGMEWQLDQAPVMPEHALPPPTPIRPRNLERTPTPAYEREFPLEPAPFEGRQIVPPSPGLLDPDEVGTAPTPVRQSVYERSTGMSGPPPLAASESGERPRAAKGRRWWFRKDPEEATR